MYRWFSKQRGQGLTLLISEVNKKGWSVVAFLRLVPIVPFSLVNYSLGLTEIPFRLYLSATILFLIPAEIIYTYFGYAGRKALKNPDYLYQSGGLALLSTAAAFLLVLTWLKRRKLKKINAHSSTLFGT
jgi:uncharacterized membrane protein YdjX (TVP38/TMEM64 family)